MQFSDPNADIYGGNPYGFAGNAGMPYMGGRRKQRRRVRGCLGCLTILLVLVVIGVLVNVIFNLSFTWGPTVIQVGASPTLIVESEGTDNSAINKHVLHIHVGSQSGQIVIQPSRPLGIPFGPAETYQISSDHETVIYNYGYVSEDTSGTFDITVPAQTNLKVDTNGWELQVEGVTGQMILTTNSGPLIVKNCHILGPSLLRSNSGELQITQDQLSGSALLDDNSADITFQGSLDPRGIYRFTNNQGKTTVTLPQNQRVHIDATTNGTITSSIPQAKAQQAAFGNGFELHANLGDAPRANLSLSNNQGSITLNEQGGN